ncbi:MAG: hypothetical protein FJZ62_05965, partial [Chlamydiae bacterium]|nr:hypothetical protein [Chlamydiota bacterium]
MTQPIGAVPGYSYRNDKLQLSSTDNKIKSFVKTAFEKISTFFATCYNYCKTKYAALKAKITFYFKKSAPTASEELSIEPVAANISKIPEEQSKQNAASRLQAMPRRKQAPPILTPETGALVLHRGSQEAAGNSKDQDTMNSMIARSLRMLIAYNFELPPIELPPIQLEELPTAASQLQGAINSKEELTPDTRRDPVNVLANAIVFAQKSFKFNTSPNAYVEIFSQLSPDRKQEIFSPFVAKSSPQTQPEEPFSSKVPLALFGASAAVITGAAVLKNDPELFTRLASGAAQCARPVLAKA